MRLYLDIDGVITAAPSSIPGIESLGVGNCLVDWHPALFGEIADRFEIVWATSWICAPGELDRLEHDLDVQCPRVDLTYEEYITTHNSRSCGKLRAVRRHFEADPAPFIWADDHMGLLDRVWASEVGGYAIAPSYDEGGLYALLDVLEVMCS